MAEPGKEIVLDVHNSSISMGEFVNMLEGLSTKKEEVANG